MRDQQREAGGLIPNVSCPTSSLRDSCYALVTVQIHVVVLWGVDVGHKRHGERSCLHFKGQLHPENFDLLYLHRREDVKCQVSVFVSLL
jgi:hypothetical protein